MTPAWKKAFKAALVFTVAFGLCGLWIFSSLGGGPPGPEEVRMLRWLYGIGLLSGFLTSLVIWWAVVGRPRKSGVGRGLISGIAIGVLLHPVCWSLASVANALTHGGSEPLFGDPPSMPLQELAMVVRRSVVSLLFFGWMTVAAGALAGGMLGRRRDC